MIYEVAIRFDRFPRLLEKYEVECDDDDQVIDKAKDMVVDGFASIEGDAPEYCDLEVMDGERMVYSKRLYPCDDGLTENKTE